MIAGKHNVCQKCVASSDKLQGTHSASNAINEIKQDLGLLKELIEAGKIKGVIDRTYRLEKTADAHRYVETGRKKGNVVITINP